MAKKKVIPISVLIEACYICNENCIHCCLDNRRSKGMTLAQYENLFDQLAKAGTFFVILTGGEPFMRKDFMDIVAAARKRRLSVTIFTNGTLLSKNIVARLKVLNVQEMHVSIYSADSKIHDKITGVKGSFQKSINAIKWLVENKITVRIKCPLMNATVSGIKEIKELALNLGAQIQFTMIITAKNDGNTANYKLRLTRQQIGKILVDKEIIEYSKTPMCFQENLDCIPCDAVLNAGAVDPCGDVYVCNQLRIKGGNVLENSFKEIWDNSLTFQQMRTIRLRHLSECKKCDLFQFCARCPGLALLEDGDLRGCSSIAKIIAEERKKIGIYPVQSHIFSKI